MLFVAGFTVDGALETLPVDGPGCQPPGLAAVVELLGLYADGVGL